MKIGDLVKSEKEIIGIEDGDAAKIELSEIGLVVDVRLARSCNDTEYRYKVQFNSGKTWWVGKDEILILNKC